MIGQLFDTLAPFNSWRSVAIFPSLECEALGVVWTGRSGHRYLGRPGRIDRNLRVGRCDRAPSIGDLTAVDSITDRLAGLDQHPCLAAATVQENRACRARAGTTCENLVAGPAWLGALRRLRQRRAHWSADKRCREQISRQSASSRHDY